MSEQKFEGDTLGPLADNERLKEQSDYLRGTIDEDLGDPITGGFTADNFQLIRFHGMYQQDDRDIRAERQKQKIRAAAQCDATGTDAGRDHYAKAVAGD